MAETAPFRTVSDAAVRAGAWCLSLRDGDEPLPEWLPDWDMSKRLAIARALSFDADLAYEESGLPRGAGLALSVLCSSAIELEACHVELPNDGGDISLEIELDGSTLGAAVVLSTRVVLSEEISAPSQERRVAWRRGSVLWEDSRGVRLYGDASQFPVMEADFRTLGLDESAPWFLQLGHDLELPAMGSVLLLLNDRFPLVLEAAREIRSPQPELAVTRSILMTDVGRALVESALAHDDLGEGWPEESLGAVLFSVVASRFEEEIDELREIRQQDPTRWASMVNSTFGLLRGMPQ